MLTVSMILLFVEFIITFYMIKSLMDMVLNLPDSWFKIIILKFIMHPVVVFITNFMVSSIISIFTGSGLFSGMANLTSSVIAGIILPAIMNNRIDLDLIRKKIDEQRCIKKNKS